MVILLGLLFAAPAAAQAGHRHARATDSPAEAAPLAPAEAAPLARVGVAPRRLTGYAMDDSNIKTAVEAWLSDSAAAEATYGHISTWETGGVTDMSYLFCAKSGSYYASRCNAAAASFNEDISAWDTSGVTSTYRMFWYASAFNQNLSGWSLDSVTNFISMFQYAYAFDQELGWCVADDADLGDVFDGTQCASTSCGVNWAAAVICGGSGGTIDDGTIETAVGRWLSTPGAAEAMYGHISTWETAQVTDMSYLFFRSTFDEDISAWDTSGVTTMKFMFDGASAFNQPLNKWRVDKVTDMGGMFAKAWSFNQPLNDWRVDSVTNMQSMLEEASSFNQPLNDWRVDQVKTTREMFQDAESFNQDLSDWAIHSVTSMAEMFNGASDFDQDLGWCVDYDVALCRTRARDGQDFDCAFDGTRCESTSCGVTHGICWGRGKNRRGVGRVWVIVICLILAICVPLAVSFCFLAGTFGSCSKHKKTQSKTQLPEDPSSDKV
jgi:hypothetical protein